MTNKRVRRANKDRSSIQIHTLRFDFSCTDKVFPLKKMHSRIAFLEFYPAPRQFPRSYYPFPVFFHTLRLSSLPFRIYATIVAANRALSLAVFALLSEPPLSTNGQEDLACAVPGSKQVRYLSIYLSISILGNRQEIQY